mmetsp:Transcript_21865/g.72429  ORF Transcript_21865/g.72429 Transcript_21865/m.72429 type:complete len:407 (-) Transcript_21865:1016-2236(-)
MQGIAATGTTRTEALRKRRSGSAAEPEPEAASSHIASVVKSLDVYPKTLDDFKERTGSGAAVSVVSLSIIFLLVISEFYAYLTPTTTDHLYVDTSRGERIRVNLNLTFPNMPCAGMSLVAMDVAGEQQIDVVSNIIKTRRRLDGSKIGVELDDAHLRRQMAGKCGSCFQKRDEMPEAEGQCCNSCADVQSVYRAKALKRLVWEEHPLCQHEAMLLEPARLASIHEGCNLFGFLEVNKVAGNVHLAPGKAFQSAQGQLVHEFKPFDSHGYNISHVIHSLSFGVHYPGRQSPLDESTMILHNGSGVFQYYLKVVPTTYVFASGRNLTSCQYSVTEQFKSAHDPRNGFVLPGVFFIYDISPIMVTFREERPAFSYFLTSLCAIVGGVFTVAGIVDSCIYSASGGPGLKM